MLWIVVDIVDLIVFILILVHFVILILFSFFIIFLISDSGIMILPFWLFLVVVVSKNPNFLQIFPQIEICLLLCSCLCWAGSLHTTHLTFVWIAQFYLECEPKMLLSLQIIGNFIFIVLTGKNFLCIALEHISHMSAHALKRLSLYILFLFSASSSSAL